jgi:hypothetical protein
MLWFFLVDGIDSLPATDVEVSALSTGVRGALGLILRVSEEFPEEPVDNPILALAKFPLAFPSFVSPVRLPLEEYLKRDRVFGPGQLIDE